ncbi:hypothetical protein DMN91_012312 [Ooceraea biroi]|uniref:RING-type E3 ubiquitin transferase n=1 Tax=Ooceraea biroi TaxID=2015173 RepID=A0A026VT89_OOCBI|nr:E3 ubiquitin-protein ligase RFWD3 [Ooceraea biroi]EZA46696.1 E3 ubiquitin-protein ligase RFWD3 [Ooceraea biroi]RLU15318.1 hypothetical protein DMN91_012312 [Ooceraea biroi]
MSNLISNDLFMPSILDAIRYNHVEVETEEQQAVQIDQEHSYNDDNAESNDKADGVPKGSQQEDAVSRNLDESDTDSDQACPICMEQWTSAGEHRLCCLRCGHLFGHSCILRWLQHSCNSTNRRCPQCNKKAAVKHIRMLYAKKLTTIDTSEYEQLKRDLSNASAEKQRLHEELSQYNIRQSVYEQQLACMKKRIADLESHQRSEIMDHASQSASNLSAKKFHLERSVEICKEEGCRVLDYNPWHRLLVTSQKSSNHLFKGYGIRKFDCEYFNLRQFIFLHADAIRDVTFHSTQQELLLSVGFDKCAKLLDVHNNTTVHTYEMQHSLWSCCWSGDNPYVFLTGTQNGIINQFDIRQTSSAVSTLDGHGDRSPVVSMATVPPNPGSGVSRGGFIACRLNSCYAYEVKDSAYVPKQVFLEGPFVCVRYDERNRHYLISSRPSVRQSHARHVVCTIEKSRSNEDVIMCNAVHTLQAGNSQQLLSRPCHLYADNDTLVAAHVESNSTVSLWSVGSGRQLHSLPVTDPVLDLCSFDVNNYLVLATLSKKRLRLYNYGQLA